MLLGIDTATRSASVALYDATGLLAERTWRSANNHSVELLPAIAEMLAQQRAEPTALEAVAVAQGPGSFTGLRIGMSTAKGLALALSIPLIAVPTLDVTAYSVGDPGVRVWAVLEAGRGRLCVAGYRHVAGLPVQEGEIALVRASEWQPPTTEPAWVVGELSAQLADRLRTLEGATLTVATPAFGLRRAGYLAELAWRRLQRGQVDDLDSLAPLYIHYPASGYEG